MLRRARYLMPMAALLVLLPQSAVAATVNVSMDDNFFSPEQTQAVVGDTVHWTNDGLNFHTSTGDDPLAFWDSGFMSSGSTFDLLFWGAGTFPYHCAIHLDMTGRISARPNVMPRSGPLGTQFTVRAGSKDAPAPYVFDIQRRDPGGGWHGWLNNVVGMDSVFDSTGRLTGTYRFRGRTRDTSLGAASSWSPSVSVSVTP
jgi:plastocyanin